MEQRYLDFLASLSIVKDEKLREKCYQAWIHLYKYYDHSAINELNLRNKVQHLSELLYKLDQDQSSLKSNLIHRVRYLMKLGKKTFYELYEKWHNKLCLNQQLDKEISYLKQKRMILINLIHSLMNQDDTTYEKELTIQNMKYFRLTIQLNSLNENIQYYKVEFNDYMQQFYYDLNCIHRKTQEMIKIKELSHNLEINQQQQLIVDLKSIVNEIAVEAKLQVDLKCANKLMDNNITSNQSTIENNQIKKIEMANKLTELDKNIEIHLKIIEHEKYMKQQIKQDKFNILNDIKRNQHHVVVQKQQKWILQNRVIMLQSEIVQSNNNNTNNVESSLQTDKLKLIKSKQKFDKQVQHEFRQHLAKKDLVEKIEEMKIDVEHNKNLVKHQRAKIVGYERLHDKWILTFDNSREHLLKIFDRFSSIENLTQQTILLFEDLKKQHKTIRSKIIFEYNEIYITNEKKNKLFDQNDLNVINTDESKHLIMLKIKQMEKYLRSTSENLQHHTQKLKFIQENMIIIRHQIPNINANIFELKRKNNQIDQKLLRFQALISKSEYAYKMLQQTNINESIFIHQKILQRDILTRKLLFAIKLIILVKGKCSYFTHLFTMGTKYLSNI
ncbi:unnamed protein product, partial [Didymodactylos carnosus]